MSVRETSPALADWQTPIDMAQTLGVTRRRVKEMVAFGDLERRELGSRILVRRRRRGDDERGRERLSLVTTGPDPVAVPAVTGDAATPDAELARELADEVVRLHDDLRAMELERERDRTERAALQRECRQLERAAERVAAQKERLGQDLADARVMMETEAHRASLLEQAASLPFWARARKKQLILQAQGLRKALPPGD